VHPGKPIRSWLKKVANPQKCVADKREPRFEVTKVMVALRSIINDSERKGVDRLDVSCVYVYKEILAERVYDSNPLDLPPFFQTEH
jgi:hypothetical protein